MNKQDNLEAKSWLKNNKNVSALASNRFGDTSNAYKFVEQLYKLGAIKVIVDNIYDEEDRINEEGGPYADSLIIKLPQNQQARQELFKVFKQEHEQQGFDETIEDEGQPFMILWWD